MNKKILTGSKRRYRRLGPFPFVVCVDAAVMGDVDDTANHLVSHSHLSRCVDALMRYD